MVSGIYLPLRKLLLDFVHLISSSNHDSYRLQGVYALLSFSGNAGSTIVRVVVVVVVVVVSIVIFLAAVLVVVLVPENWEGGSCWHFVRLVHWKSLIFFPPLMLDISCYFCRGTTGVDDSLTEPWPIDV